MNEDDIDEDEEAEDLPDFDEFEEDVIINPKDYKRRGRDIKFKN